MSQQSLGSPHPSVALQPLARSLTMCCAILWTASASAQTTNPYGRVDSADASVEALRLTVGRAASPTTLEVFSAFEPPDRFALLEGLLEHASPTIRVIAARELIELGADPSETLLALPEPQERNALVVNLFDRDLLSPESGGALLAADPDLGITARVILRTLAGDRTGLENLGSDTELPELARGVRSAAMETETPGAVAAWLAELTSGAQYSDAQCDRIVFEVLAIARRLELLEAVGALAAWSEARPADDALRAAAVLSMLELEPEKGLPAWRRLHGESSSSRRISTGLLLVTAGVAAPADLQPLEGARDALQGAIWRLVQTSPESRGVAAQEVVARGHAATTQWVLSRPEIEVPAETLLVVLDHVLENRRAKRMAAGIEAATQVAMVDPAAVAARIRRALDDGDPIGASIGLRGLVAAGTPRSAELAATFRDAPQRNVRSLALLAMARGDLLEDDTLVRQLGRAAAGGGELPDDLRPLAAWYYLRSQDRLPADIPRILDS